MPLFFWKGIDSEGIVKKGYTSASSLSDVDTLLLQNDIALLDYSVYNPTSVLRPISQQEVALFFKRLGVLLESGVFIDEALVSVAEQTSHKTFQSIIEDILASISQGNQLYTALSYYPTLFNSVVVHMVMVGQETGLLASVMTSISTYLTSLIVFKKNIKKVSFLPLVSFGFFCVVAGIIFFYIVPAFADIFTSSGKELPWITKKVINIRASLSKTRFLYGSVILLLVVMLFRQLLKKPCIKYYIDRCLLSTPFLGSMMITIAFRNYFYALALLIKSGAQIVPALNISLEALHNSVLKHYGQRIVQAIEQGSSLSSALATVPGKMFLPDVKPLIHAGQESGQLGEVLQKIVAVYNENIDQRLTFMTIIIQPALMIILGLLISFLIVSVYLPVFTIADVVS